MKEQEIFIRADEELDNVIQQIRDDQWEMTLPEDFNIIGDNKTYTLREMIDYHAYDEAWIPTMLAGKTMEEVGKDAFGRPFDNDLLGESPKENYAALSEKAIAAAREIPEDELDSRIVHFSYGDYPAREALWHMTIFRGLRVYTLEKVLGQDTDMPDDLVQGLWDIIHPHAEEWREVGIFGPEIEVPEDAPLQDRLLGLTGHQP